MKQDIVAAAWHAELGTRPDTDPTQALAASKAKWAPREADLIELVHQQAGIPKVLEPMVLIEKARAFRPSAAELAELEQQFHYGVGARDDDE